MGYRHPAQRDRDLADIARMYLIEHKTQAQIAETLSNDPERNYTISQQQISYDLRSLRKKWLKSAMVDFTQARAEELARVDRLEAEYWDAWQASKEITTARGVAGEDDPVVTQKYGPGDPAFLAGVERCIKMRVDLLGLQAPKLLAVVDEDFDQEKWAKDRAARHAEALSTLEEADDDSEAQ